MIQVQLIGSDRSIGTRNSKDNRITYRSSTAFRRQSGHTAASSGKTTLSSAKLLRLLFIPLAALVLFAGLSMLSASAEPDTVRPAKIGESVVTVDSGDTLWSIAQDVKPFAMKTGAAVHLIMKRNGLSSSSLSSGQSLILPEKLSHSR
ncbi:LysM peptidoglycan-binding domain-containing protein [Cohnella sp. 56]|uniref:LysM peptidoglycan-binding domain-containing protein n=1 Tax=Cohnella sp. 56 TaxID=3113722 RepID=UPI0030E90A02